jgi:large subunit ribosomal protein L29
MDIATIRAKEASELQELLAEQRAHLADLRFRMSTHELAHTHELRAARRIIARILTVLHDRTHASATVAGAK